MFAKVASVGVLGIDAYAIEVECNVAHGLRAAVIVGLPDAAVKESLQRVQAAIVNRQYRWPRGHITVNLAPADTRKEGPAYDLPIAIGLLAAGEQIEAPRLAEFAMVGELALDGCVRSVRGVLPMALAVRQTGLAFIVPEANAPEAAVVAGLAVYPVRTLDDALGLLTDRLLLEPRKLDIASLLAQTAHSDVDFSDVKGQEHAKRALLVAAAGHHNVLMIGPPGSGKTMLARRLPTILPPLTLEEALEVTKVHSVAGELPAGQALVATRPFRDPHHTASTPALVGGGSSYPRPGEISLAHKGILFLDELPEFNRSTLETLRQPIESGTITISRALMSVRFPAEVLVAAAMNACVCGGFGDATRECRCTVGQIRNYMSRISGPLLDRIDIHIEVPRVPYRDLRDRRAGATSAEMREQVAAARERQRRRFAGERISTNARMTNRHIHRYCQLDGDCEALLEQAMSQHAFSARSYTRILKMARTIADLAGDDGVHIEHITEAIQYRTTERHYWR